MGMDGAEPIGWNEISDWATLMNNKPSLEEIQMLIAMDGAFRSAIADERPKKEGPQ